VKGVVDAHGGRIWVQSAAGQGTTFRFVVPLGEPGGASHVEGTSPQGAAVPASPPTDQARAPSQATAFLADDDDAFRGALREAPVARGYDVREATDGATALGWLASVADGSQPGPDVVVLDVRMPGCSGLGVLNAMGKLAVMPPTLVVTGFRDPSIHVLAQRLGVFRILFKPLDVDEVVEVAIEAARKGPGRRAAQAVARSHASWARPRGG
jgi:DNA-binding NtrC family response regulator